MIPLVIHQMWVGSPMPDYMKVCQRTWLDLHPTWVYVDWGDHVEASIVGDVPPFRNQHLINNADSLSPEPIQFISDVVRYEILHQYGGVWVDMDMECQKPIDELCDVVAFMGWEVPRRWLNNAIIGSEPETAFLEEVITKLPESINKGVRANTRMSGPQYVTPIALKHKITTYPKDYFYPYLWNELDRWVEDFPDSYAVHHWNNRRKRL